VEQSIVIFQRGIACEYINGYHANIQLPYYFIDAYKNIMLYKMLFVLVHEATRK